MFVCNEGIMKACSMPYNTYVQSDGKEPETEAVCGGQRSKKIITGAGIYGRRGETPKECAHLPLRLQRQLNHVGKASLRTNKRYSH